MIGLKSSMVIVLSYMYTYGYNFFVQVNSVILIDGSSLGF